MRPLFRPLLVSMLKHWVLVAASSSMTCFKLAMPETAVALLAVQFVEKEDVRIWSNGLGP